MAGVNGISKNAILVVDDEASVCHYMQQLLLRNGYESVSCAASGEAAREAIEKNRPSLVISDVSLGGMSGIELVREMRASDETRLIPVILITGMSDTQSRIAGKQAGCDDFITKPFESEEMLARVKTLLRMNFYRQALDEKEKFEYVMGHIVDGIIVLDAGLRVKTANKKAAKLLALDKTGGSFTQWLGSRFAVHYGGDLGRAICAGPLIFDVERPDTTSEKALIMEAETCPILNPSGELDSIVMVLSDVTEKRRESLIKQNFLAMISHKLRTPLSAVTAHAAMFADETYGPLSAQQKSAADSLALKAKYLAELVDKLLGFTAISIEQGGSAGKGIDLKEWFALNLDELVKPLTKIKQAAFALDCPAGVRARIGDRQLFSLLKNLLENAVKFCDKTRAEVKIRASLRGQDCVLEIEDNGCGIPPEERDKIFDGFYQVEKYFTGNVEGAGLGLAIARRIAALNDGKVDVESELGKGSVFTITLPAVV